jgi:hypothetical protein
MSGVKLNYFTLFVSSLVFIIPFSINSQTLISEKSSAFPDTNYKISLEQWMPKGNFRMHGGPKTLSNTWELTHPIDGNILQVLFQGIPEKDSPYLINISLSSGNIKKGSISDTDWDGNGVVSDLSYSTSQGDIFISSFAVDYCVTDIKQPYELNLTFAYNYLRTSVDYRNPIIVIDDYVPTHTILAIKWEVYNMVYEGLEIGIKGKSNISTNLSVEAYLGYTPFVGAEYKGTRYPGTTSEQTEHIISSGNALSYELRLSCNLVNQFYIQSGYKYTTYRTKGKDQSDGYWKWIGSREELDADFKGFFFGLGINF